MVEKTEKKYLFIKFGLSVRDIEKYAKQLKNGQLQIEKEMKALDELCSQFSAKSPKIEAFRKQIASEPDTQKRFSIFSQEISDAMDLAAYIKDLLNLGDTGVFADSDLKSLQDVIKGNKGIKVDAKFLKDCILTYGFVYLPDEEKEKYNKQYTELYKKLFDNLPTDEAEIKKFEEYFSNQIDAEYKNDLKEFNANTLYECIAYIYRKHKSSSDGTTEPDVLKSKSASELCSIIDDINRNILGLMGYNSQKKALEHIIAYCKNTVFKNDKSKGEYDWHLDFFSEVDLLKKLHLQTRIASGSLLSELIVHGMMEKIRNYIAENPRCKKIIDAELKESNMDIDKYAQHILLAFCTQYEFQFNINALRERNEAQEEEEENSSDSLSPKNERREESTLPTPSKNKSPRVVVLIITLIAMVGIFNLFSQGKITDEDIKKGEAQIRGFIAAWNDDYKSNAYSKTSAFTVKGDSVVKNKIVASFSKDRPNNKNFVQTANGFTLNGTNINSKKGQIDYNVYYKRIQQSDTNNVTNGYRYFDEFYTITVDVSKKCAIVDIKPIENPQETVTMAQQYVATANANIFLTPDTNGVKLGNIKKNETYKYTDKRVNNKESWVRIMHPTRRLSWVQEKYLTAPTPKVAQSAPKQTAKTSAGDAKMASSKMQAIQAPQPPTQAAKESTQKAVLSAQTQKKGEESIMSALERLPLATYRSSDVPKALGFVKENSSAYNFFKQRINGGSYSLKAIDVNFVSYDSAKGTAKYNVFEKIKIGDKYKDNFYIFEVQTSNPYLIVDIHTRNNPRELNVTDVGVITKNVRPYLTARRTNSRSEELKSGEKVNIVGERKVNNDKWYRINTATSGLVWIDGADVTIEQKAKTNNAAQQQKAITQQKAPAQQKPAAQKNAATQKGASTTSAQTQTTTAPEVKGPPPGL